MSHGFIDSPEGLRYAEHISTPLRLFAGVIGLAMLLIPVPFLLHAHLGLPWWQLVLVALCVVFPGLVGLLFLTIALGRCLRLHFDTPRRRLTRNSRFPLMTRLAFVAYSQVEPPTLQERSSEDGPYFVIRLGVRGERPMHLGSFERREEGEQWRGRIAGQLQGEDSADSL
ncbi:hypothetical protein [Ottowia thiooxydans]|uniref:hypothetical protein n=1 Tax=Ottowia thiooxydans TaxID=219182 RepID=UPI0004002468|nr:hypothetical protein [Ottowia thiooxydans]